MNLTKINSQNKMGGDQENLNNTKEVDPVDNIDELDEDDDQCDIYMSMCGEFLNKDYIIENKMTIE
jgi:hypothetical protein